MEIRDARALSDFARAVESVGLRYVVGGSIAAGYFGEPRATLDIDVLIEVHVNDLDRLTAAFAEHFLMTRDALCDAFEKHIAFNAYHRASFTKFDVYVAVDDSLDRAQLERRQPKLLLEGSDEVVYVTSAEVIVLRKLAWFRRSNLTSELQWRDVLGVIKQQGSRLDRNLMVELAAATGLTYLLRRAFEESEPA